MRLTYQRMAQLRQVLMRRASIGDEGFRKTATVEADGNIVTVSDSNGFEMKFEVEPGTAGTDFTDATADGGTAASASGGTPADVKYYSTDCRTYGLTDRCK